ncbi:MAG: hypothetical protein LKH33_06795 [Acetobacter sp.]|jgi:nucleoside phosphorylase|nr:hypothetical protein [Acetobacter sp.]MCH4060486.1 hypothetical protein [Acetobacter sp.]MCH4087426.1 hypothetical protein [Acetobacter sp.]MCI1293944.1 hypothetical protein [Acetobacter sp.]MCI1320462.1 hypothetical protein [Acetobacter sp.]
MKRVTFTDSCGGIGSVYNRGDVAVFPDAIADAIVASKKGTAVPIAAKAAAPPEENGDEQTESSDPATS